MKNIFLAAGIMLTAGTVTFAHTNFGPGDPKATKVERREERKDIRKERRAEERTDVNIMTRNKFAEDFPDAQNPRFVKDKNYDVVYFMSGKNRLKAYYDYSSNLIGTTQRKSFSDLPQDAQNTILKKYAGYNTVAVIRFVDNQENDTNMILYGTAFEDADNYFVELKNDKEALVLKVDDAGYVTYFKDIK